MTDAEKEEALYLEARDVSEKILPGLVKFLGHKVLLTKLAEMSEEEVDGLTDFTSLSEVGVPTLENITDQLMYNILDQVICALYQGTEI